MEQKKQVSVLGYAVSAAAFSETVTDLEARLEKGEKTAVFALNPLKIEAANADPAVKEALQSAELLIPDGSGILWAAKKLGESIPERVTGVDLMDAICQIASRRSIPVFLYGTTEGHLDAACKALQECYPELPIAGRRNGFTGDTEGDLAAIRESHARILFVAMGSPKQELFIAAHRESLPEVLLFQGVGGSLDVLAGAVPRAPKFWRKLRLEWLWRMLRQPKRFLQLKILFSFIKKVNKNAK